MKHILFFLLLVLSPAVFAQESVSSQSTDKTVIEGVFTQVSKLPSAEVNAYPDCYYTATISINHIVSGQSIPKKIILVLPGFFSRQYTPEAKYKTGDKIRAVVVPFASMSDKVRQTQQADEIEDVDLNIYFPEKIAPIGEFKIITEPVPFAIKNQKSEQPPDFQSVDLKARVARQEAMRNDLEQIDTLLGEHGGDWDKWYDSLKDFRSEYKKQIDAKAQRWVGDSFFSAGHLDNGKIYDPEFIKTVIAFKNYLAARNIDLILVRIPNKGELVDDLFAPLPADQVSNPYVLRMYKELLEADVEIISDIIPQAKAARLKYPLMYWYQNFSEVHPAEGMVWVVAEAFAKRLNRYDKIRNTTRTTLKQQRVSSDTTSSHTFFWPEGNPKFKPKDYAEFSGITTQNGMKLVPKRGLDSPVLVMGSSFIEFPSLLLGSNIPSYLAYLTGIVPDILFRAGDDKGIPRAIAREGDDFLKNRVVCVLPMVPWTPYGALSSPPILDPNKLNKVLLASYGGKDLGQNIRFGSETPNHSFKYSEEGNLAILPLNEKSMAGGNFDLLLTEKISKFQFFMVEIESRIGDYAVIKANYGPQTDTVYKSSTQNNKDEVFIFKSDAGHVVNLNFGGIREDRPTVIKKINIFGLTK